MKACSGGQINHAVTIYGYFTKTHPKTGEMKGHWKVQNSFGTEWGMNGHMRIAMFEEGYGVCNMYSTGVWTANF